MDKTIAVDIRRNVTTDSAATIVAAVDVSAKEAIAETADRAAVITAANIAGSIVNIVNIANRVNIAGSVVIGRGADRASSGNRVSSRRPHPRGRSAGGLIRSATRALCAVHMPAISPTPPIPLYNRTWCVSTNCAAVTRSTPSGDVITAIDRS